jgi:hypothetical protein
LGASVRVASAIGAVLVLGALAAGCGSTRTVVRTVTVGKADQRFFGQIKSLVRVDGHYELQFDPAWFLTGVTANVALAEDSGTPCQPTACPPVSNDNYTVDESHRTLTFLVPNGVRGTVLVTGATSTGPFPARTVSVSRLAQVVAGTSRLKLFEPLSSGVWIVVHNDTVRGFAQQYRP